MAKEAKVDGNEVQVLRDIHYRRGVSKDFLDVVF